MGRTTQYSIGILILSAMLGHPSAVWTQEVHQPAPGKKIKVFLCAGQSNMEGRADGSQLTPNDRERLSKIQSRVQLTFNHQPVCALDVVRPSKEIAQIYQRSLIFGPELFFGIAIAEAMPEEEILLIKLAAGGTSLHGCWNPDWQVDNATLMEEQDAPRLYDEFTRYLKEVLSDLDDDEYEISGMLWVQGETDAQHATAALAYGINLQRLIQQIRNDLDNEGLPFVLFEVGKGRVTEGMKSTARKLPNVILIPQSQNPESPDFYAKMKNGHYNFDGMKKLGQRFADTLLSQQKNATERINGAFLRIHNLLVSCVYLSAQRKSGHTPVAVDIS